MIIKGNGFSKRYKIIVQTGVFSKLHKYVDLNRKTLFVIDRNVPRRLYEKITKKHPVCFINAKEENKNSKNAFEIIKILISHQFDRTDNIISIGGGITSDLTGFAASIYKRGINWINIPTTTLAMVDASIGGKTGFNHDGIKNLIGSFYFPSLVLIDINFLKSLPDNHYFSGLCESIKMGITLDPKILKLVKEDVHNNINKIIARSIRAKNRVVKKDLMDQQTRHVLNYGHTFGHAFEMVDRNLLHGEAVLLGMRFSSSPKMITLIDEYLKLFDIKFDKHYPFDSKIRPLLMGDKKKDGDTIDFVYVEAIKKYEVRKMSIFDLKNIYERR